MPSGAIIFRLFLFFIFLGVLFTAIVWIITRVFGIELNYWKRISDWRLKKKEEEYDKQFQKVTGGYYDDANPKKKK